MLFSMPCRSAWNWTTKTRPQLVVLETFSEILYRTERDTVSAPLPKELSHHLGAAETEHTRERVERLDARPSSTAPRPVPT